MTTLSQTLPQLPHDVADEAPVCAHVTRRGRRCDTLAAEGETLCIVHGASLARAKETLQRKMLALCDKAVEVHAQLLSCYDPKVQMQAVIAAYDRNGLGPKSTLTIEESKTDFRSMSNDEFFAFIESEYRSLAHEASQRLPIAATPAAQSTERTH